MGPTAENHVIPSEAWESPGTRCEKRQGSENIPSYRFYDRKSHKIDGLYQEIPAVAALPRNDMVFGDWSYWSDPGNHPTWSAEAVPPALHDIKF